MKSNVPEGWSHPNPVMIGNKTVTGGMVWIGTARMTVEDAEALKAVTGPGTIIDHRSIVGKYDARWTTFYNEYTDNPIPSGGIGSECYELQLVGEQGGGVQFTKDEIFAIDPANPDAGIQHGIPPNEGAYHTVFSDGYADAYWGPAPGSVAEEMLGDGHYEWDIARSLYIIVEDAD